MNVTDEMVLDARTVNAVLKALDQPVRNATEACAIVRHMATESGLKISDDTELSNGDFSPWMGRGEMVKRAIQGVSDLEEWCHNNEAEWSGWGDQVIPAGAIRWTAQAKLALDLIKDNVDPAALSAAPVPAIDAEDLPDEFNEDGSPTYATVRDRVRRLVSLRTLAPAQPVPLSAERRARMHKALAAKYILSEEEMDGMIDIIMAVDRATTPPETVIRTAKQEDRDTPAARKEDDQE